MNTTTRICRNLAVVMVAAASCLGLSGCDGDYAVPITSIPTRKIDSDYWATGSLKLERKR